LPITLQPGDVIYVPGRKRPSAIASIASREFFRIFAASITSFILFRLLR